MAINLSLAQIFFEAFGYRNPAFEPNFVDQRGDNPDDSPEAFGYRNPAFEPNFVYQRGDNPDDSPTKNSYGTQVIDDDLTGQKVYLPIYLEYPVLDNEGNVLQTNQWTLYYAVVGIDVNKLLVKTAMTERKGEVIEIINTGSYTFNIDAFLINTDANEMPEAELTTLKNVFETDAPIKMKCGLTDAFLGVNEVIITRMKIHKVKGVKNVRPIELELVSDSILNLIDLG